MSNSFNENDNFVSPQEIFFDIMTWIKYLLNKKYSIFLFTLLAIPTSLLYYHYKSTTYTASLTFIIEDSKSNSSNLGGLTSLAGQFGVDLGGSINGGILSGENILLYFKSPSLAREVLLSKYDSSSNKTIADVYKISYNLSEKWNSNKSLKDFSFSTSKNEIHHNRIQDSLLQILSKEILTKQFVVMKPDKKASFIEVSTTMKDEGLAKVYCEKIVQKVVERYTSLKIQRQKATVEKLEKRLDSVEIELRKRTINAASIQNSSNTMDINPIFKTGTTVAAETSVRDKTLLQGIYASIIQNLELAKFTLSQETPVIQIIDSPILPLKKNELSLTKTFLLFSAVFFITIIFSLISFRLFKNFREAKKKTTK